MFINLLDAEIKSKNKSRVVFASVFSIYYTMIFIFSKKTIYIIGVPSQNHRAEEVDHLLHCLAPVQAEGCKHFHELHSGYQKAKF